MEKKGNTTILVVEDESIVALSQARLLEKNGYYVLTALNGEKAVAAIEEDPSIDLVLMDVDLGSGISGAESARRILARREIPIVFVSSFSDRESVERVMDITHYGYVTKSAGPYVLLSAVQAALKLFSAGASVESALRRSDRLNETIINSFPDLLFRVGRDGVFLDFLAGKREELYVPPEEFIGKPASVIFSEEFSSVLQNRIRRALETGNLQFYEYSMSERGKERHFESRIYPFDDNSVLTIVRDVTDWKNAVAQVKRLLDRQRVLMRESQHRIKNDMFLVRSLLTLQASYSSDEKVRTILEESAHRIDVMGRIYDTLYRNPDRDEISIRSFISDLVTEVIHSSAIGSVRFETEIDEISLSAPMSVSIGIIVNELVVNAIKYGIRDDRELRVLVSLEHDATVHIVKITVVDNGPGLPESILNGTAYGFGFIMINALIKQYDGTLETRNDDGTSVSATLSLL